MPRNGRRRIVGRIEQHEHQRREEELRELLERLRWEQRVRMRDEETEPPANDDCAA